MAEIITAPRVPRDPVPRPDAPQAGAHDDLSPMISTAKWTRLLIVTATSLLLIGFAAVLVRLSLGIHHTLLLFALGGLVAYALDPLVERLRHPIHGQQAADPKRGLSRKASVALVFVTLIALLGLGVWWLGSQVGDQARMLQRDGPQYRQRALTLAARADDQLAARHIHFSIQGAIQSPPPEVKAVEAQAGREALPVLRRFVGNLTESIIVLLIALYFLLFSADMKEKFNGMLPADLRGHVEPWQGDVNRILGGFVRGQAILALITGAAAALGLLLIGVHLWLIIGLFVVVAALIPVFGPYIGALPAITAALIGPTHIHSPVAAALAVLALFVLINETGSKVLYPKLVGQALGLHEVLVLFVLFAGLEIDGIVGTLFAAPVAALSIVTVVHLYRLWQGLPDSQLAAVAQQDAPAARREALP